MNSAVHDPAPSCDGVHCYSHMVDEPDGDRACLECGHAWATEADLLADFNRIAAESGEAGKTSVGEVSFCPFCIHDL